MVRGMEPLVIGLSLLSFLLVLVLLAVLVARTKPKPVQPDQATLLLQQQLNAGQRQHQAKLAHLEHGKRREPRTLGDAVDHEVGRGLDQRADSAELRGKRQ